MDEHMDPITYDLVVVGTGWFGLSAARTWIALHPEDQVLVLESNQSIGGTWAAERLYPGLKTNNIARRYEVPDYPMDEITYGVKDGQHIPAAVVHKYLSDVAKDTGVYERIRFEHKLASVSPRGKDGWTLEVVHGDQTSTIQTKKLILATGLTSTANIPVLPGAQDFGAPIFHAKEFYKRAETLETTKNVVILGGSKSAYDVAWAYANAGATVDILIRPDGNGPVWMSPALVTPLKRPLECLLHTRALSWFSPCPFGAEDGWVKARNFLHGTWLGRAITNAFWSIIKNDVLGLVGWDKHPETKKLQPWNSTFWTGTALGILNYEGDWLELVRSGQVRVHVVDVDHLTAKRLHLKDGTVLDADVLVCATGWLKEPSVRFVNFEQANIGLPQPSEEQAKLKAQADDKLLSMYPRLRDQPTIGSIWQEKKEKDPYRLYRFIVPPSFVQARNIAFAGQVSTLSTTACSAVQALWISAFFDGQLERLAKTDHDIAEEVMLHTQWGKWRYPCGYGASLPDLPFDCVPYHDLLLNDLGMRANRKSGLLADMFEAYGPSDYDGLLEEWRVLNKHKKEL